jgi:hypothetical protein
VTSAAEQGEFLARVRRALRPADGESVPVPGTNSRG